MQGLSSWSYMFHQDCKEDLCCGYGMLAISPRTAVFESGFIYQEICICVVHTLQRTKTLITWKRGRVLLTGYSVRIALRVRALRVLWYVAKMVWVEGKTHVLNFSVVSAFGIVDNFLKCRCWEVTCHEILTLADSQKPGSKKFRKWLEGVTPLRLALASEFFHPWSSNTSSF